MENIGEFIVLYLKDSVSEGNCKPADIRARAMEQIADLDVRIRAIKDLETMKTKLYAVVKHLGGGSKSVEFNENVDYSIPFEKLNIFFKDILYYICESIENDSAGIPNDKLMSQFGVENNKTIYSAIKWLGFRDIVIRAANTFCLQKGPKWADRPMNDKT